MAAFCRPCECCEVQNLQCNCDDDSKRPPRRPWPPEPCQPCVCHLVPPFNKKPPEVYNLPPTVKNLKKQLEPKSICFSGALTLNTIYGDSFTGRKSERPQSIYKPFVFIPSEQPVSGDTISSTSYKRWNSAPAKKIRYCKRNILGACPLDTDNLKSTYQKDFLEKPDSRRGNFSKKFFFVPSPSKMTNKSLSQDTYVAHPKAKIKLVKKVPSVYIPSIAPTGTTIYKDDYLPNEFEQRKRLPWKDYAKKRHKISKARMPSDTEYKECFIPITEHPRKGETVVAGDPCHGMCACKRPGACLPKNLNLNGLKCCDCHDESYDYCQDEGYP